MKTLMIAVLLVTSFTLVGTSTFAQQKKTTTSAMLLQNLQDATVDQNGLITLGAVNVNVSQVTVQDLVTVQSLLNNADIDVLNNALNNNEVAKNISVTLTNLLRNAKILNQNQVIVGLLSDQSGLRFVTQNARSRK